MTRRVWSLAALAALIVVAFAGIGRAQDTTCNGYEYPNPPNPAVQVTGTGPTQSDVFALHPVQLAVASGSPGDIEQGSIAFTITQPDGTAVTKGPDDRYGGASYTPPVPGDYSVTASWRQTRCEGSGAPPYWDVTTPPVPFTAAEGRGAAVKTGTVRRPKAGQAPGDATFEVSVICPGSSASRPGAIRIDVYYRLGTAKPTHASPHVGYTLPGGCFKPSKGTGRTTAQRRGRYYIHLGAAMTQVNVTRPTRLRCLVEVRERGTLIAAKSASFAPAKGGESVTPGH